jgi:polar amino acid transport system substrate-binding protein
MGDLVRSRTYEAFFPLIAVTVIYFLLEGLLDLILKRVARQLDPRARSREDILKGITREE